jgi:hypothetical protein
MRYEASTTGMVVLMLIGVDTNPGLSRLREAVSEAMTRQDSTNTDNHWDGSMCLTATIARTVARRTIPLTYRRAETGSWRISPPTRPRAALGTSARWGSAASYGRIRQTLSPET